MFYEMTGSASFERGAPAGAPERPDPSTLALFLDFDGVLVDIADTPDGIDVPETLAALLNELRDCAGGALAIVSGRAKGTIERFLPEYRGDLVASHGAERRIGGETETHVLKDSEQVRAMQGVVRSFARLDDGFLVEDKPCGVVLHFRKNPELSSEAFRFMESLRGHYPEFKLQPAKMAYEIKPADIGKVASVRWLMEREPYRGRRPVYFGDDDTDEPAMQFCIEAGGAAVKVGEGETRADHRIDTVDEVRATLADWAGEAR